MLFRKEKNELFVCVKEVVMNVIKYVKMNKIWIIVIEMVGGWICEIIDFGIGFMFDFFKFGFGL